MRRPDLIRYVACISDQMLMPRNDWYSNQYMPEATLNHNKPQYSRFIGHSIHIVPFQQDPDDSRAKMDF